MAGLCPAPDTDTPLVRGLLGVVDCNVQGLVRGGYGALFEPSSGFSVLLTSLLTVYVAVLGYRLLLGQAQLRIGDLAVTAVKIGAILALTTGWQTYQTVVYDFLFRGPAQLADAMLGGFQPEGSLFRGDVFDGLQSVFDALNAFAAAFAKHAPAQPTSGQSGAAFAAMALTASAFGLLLSSLGFVLAAKVVLGLLLAVGPIFIALLLFESTRGLFEGWLRASLTFAFAPLAAILVLGVALLVLEPSLLLLRDRLAQSDFGLTPVYAITILVIVFAAVAAGVIIAGAVIALGLRLPRARTIQAAGETLNANTQSLTGAATLGRAARIAAAAAALERRDSASLAGDGAAADRRSAITMTERRGPDRRDYAGAPPEVRLGQAPRRGATPRSRRGDAGGVRSGG